MTPRILIANPNTSVIVTERLATAARSVAGARAEIVAMTAPWGVPAIESEADLAIAERAVAGMLAGATCDGAVIGAFGDPGLDVARAAAPFPVVGLGEAGFRAAGKEGRRFAVITVGASLEAAIRAKAEILGLASQLTGVRFLEGGVLDVARDPAGFQAAIEATIRAETGEAGDIAILLGGAPFSGMAAALSQRMVIPVVDGLTAAIERVLEEIA